MKEDLESRRHFLRLSCFEFLLKHCISSGYAVPNLGRAVPVAKSQNFGNRFLGHHRSASRGAAPRRKRQKRYFRPKSTLILHLYIWDLSPTFRTPRNRSETSQESTREPKRGFESLRRRPQGRLTTMELISIRSIVESLGFLVLLLSDHDVEFPWSLYGFMFD